MSFGIYTIYSDVHNPSSSAIWAVSAVYFSFLSTFVIHAISCKVELHSSRIVKKTIFGSKVMGIGDISEVGRSFHRCVLFDDEHGEKLVLPNGIGGDAFWKAWFETAVKNPLVKSTSPDLPEY